ncbi:MAG TPA: ABC transporter substrate-binding protein [Anaerolineae bacterium]|nr:ABC transporter substrate-binding protein [Anaerolineae bacterium]
MTRHIRWQAVIAIVGVVLIVVLLGYIAYTTTTVVVPDVGGTYVEGMAGRPSYINPVLCQYNQVDRDLVSLIFSSLTEINERGEIVPALARDWDVSENGLVYTFYLRRDVVWHDGEPFTADDVLFTVAAMQHEEYQGPPELGELWRTVTAEKINDYTVSFTLQAPLATFLDYTTVGVLPEHLLASVPAGELPRDQFNVRPVGTGMFKISEVSGDYVILEANPDYYGAKPLLSKVEFKFYPDYQSVFAAYQQGEVEGISEVLPEDLPRVRQEQYLNLYTARLSSYTLIFLNLDLPIFEDKEVRQALLWSIDRQRIIDQVLDGQGLVASSPIMPDSWAYNRDIPQYEYDPQMAARLLTEAGWVDTDADGVRENEGVRLEFTLLTNKDPVRRQLIEEIARQLWDVGVRVVPVVEDSTWVVNEALRPREFDALLYSWGNLPTDPDPYLMWHSTQIGGDGQNYAGLRSVEIDQLLEQGRQSTDQGERTRLYRDFQDLFADEVPSLLLYYPVYNYAVDEMVKGVQLSPMMDASDRFRTVDQWYIKTRRMMVSETGEQ